MPDFRNITEFIKDVFGYIIIFAILVFIFIFIVAFAPIAGNSMNPTLNDGDIVLVSRLSYVFSDIERYDIITFKDENNKKYVKRVIGLPGERIDYLNGYLIVDNKTIKETLVDGSKTNNFMFEDICDSKLCPDSVIPIDKYLVLGDARDDSKDSRDKSIGLVDAKEIKGKILYRIWPISGFSKIN